MMARVNVEGTRRVLEAAAAVDVHRVVRVSSAAVYGAWAEQPGAAHRGRRRCGPTRGSRPACRRPRWSACWPSGGADHPGATVTTLRTAPVLGPGAERLPSRLLLGRPALRVRGAAPPVQAVHVDDLVEALVLVALSDHPGVFNVASDGWLSHDLAFDLLPRSFLPPVPAELLERVLTRGWGSGHRRDPARRRPLPRASVGDRERRAEVARLGAGAFQRAGDPRRPRVVARAAVRARALLAFASRRARRRWCRGCRRCIACGARGTRLALGTEPSQG